MKGFKTFTKKSRETFFYIEALRARERSKLVRLPKGKEPVKVREKKINEWYRVMQVLVIF